MASLLNQQEEIEINKRNIREKKMQEGENKNKTKNLREQPHHLGYCRERSKHGSEMDQRVKVLAAKSDNQCLILGLQVVEGKH